MDTKTYTDFYACVILLGFGHKEAVITSQTSFGQWLKQRRKVLDLTRENLAVLVGCAAVTITKIEADERRPSKQMAELLAQHLNIPADEYLAFVRFARAETVESAVPWGTPFHPPTNLPAQPTPLFGRDKDVAAIRKRLLRDESRLLTLTGPPGIGKTRLALQIANQMLDDFVDGVFFIALAQITDANLVLATITNTLGILDIGPQTPQERLKVFLRDKEMLLVLDNFEQILAAAPFIAELLIVCPWLKLLATSRAPLRIRQERQIPVAPLAVPDLVHLPDMESLAGYSAMTLFLERAQAVQPNFVLTPQNAPTVVAICTRLDGLPLAIELISARVKLLSPAALLERLHGRLMLQSDGLLDLEPRHRTLNAAINWSYQLLNADEQTLFRRLGVFVGGWTLEAAAAVCLENLGLSIVDGLASLLDKSLIKRETFSQDEPRFTMLETIREYAFERLISSGEVETIRQRHADYFVTFAEIAPSFLNRTEQESGWDRLELEHANFRAALARGEGDLRLVLALVGFWRLRGHLNEASEWLARALERQVHLASGALSEADRMMRARALAALGVVEHWQGNLDAALPHHEESLRLFREIGNSEWIADVLGDYGMLFVLRGEFELAGLHLNESMALWRELGNQGGIGITFIFLGNLAYSQEQTAQAGEFWEEGLAQFRAEGNEWVRSILLAHLAMVALDQSDYHRAETKLIESLTILGEMGERWQIAQTLEVFACLEAAQGKRSEVRRSTLLRSARIFGAAEKLRETLAAPVFPFQRRFNERGLAALHVQLDKASLAAAWAEGRAMTLEQAVEYALSEG